MLKFLKKFILIIGLIAIFIVILTNLFYTGELDKNELVIIKQNSLILVASALLIGFSIQVICKILKYKLTKIKIKQILFCLFIAVYVIVQVVFILAKQNLVPCADQEIAYLFANSLTEGTTDYFIDNTNVFGGGLPFKIYIERYKHQITLAFLWKVLFSVFNNNSLMLIRAFNVLGNILTLISILLICNELSKKYNINKYLAIIMIGTFTSLIYLVTFIYGDLLGLGFAMLGVYFIMKYVSEKKIRYAITSSILMSIAYMLRMNYLIFVIAILIYLFLDLIDKNNYLNKTIENNEDKTLNIEKQENKIEQSTKINKPIIKNIITKSLVIICFTIIVFAPAKLIKDDFCKKANIDKDKEFQVTGYLYMGMSETPYCYGWYIPDYASYSFNEYEKADSIYRDGVKERVKYFINNPKYFFDFYNKKISTMWAENTYAGLFYNQMFDNPKETKIVALYQKALIFIIFGCTLVVLIQNRKNLSNEVILLLTIFIGGFLFHILWEAKSRYIIPYIVALIPIASIEISKIKLNKKYIKK